MGCGSSVAARAGASKQQPQPQPQIPNPQRQRSGSGEKAGKKKKQRTGKGKAAAAAAAPFDAVVACGAFSVKLRGVTAETTVRDAFEMFAASDALPPLWQPRALAKNGVRMRLERPHTEKVFVVAESGAERRTPPLAIALNTPFRAFGSRVRCEAVAAAAAAAAAKEEGGEKKRLSARVDSKGLRFGGQHGCFVAFRDAVSKQPLEALRLSALGEACPAEWKAEGGVVVLMDPGQSCTLEFFAANDPVAVQLLADAPKEGANKPSSTSQQQKQLRGAVVVPPTESLATMLQSDDSLAELRVESEDTVIAAELRVLPSVACDADYSTDDPAWRPVVSPKMSGLKPGATLRMSTHSLGSDGAATLGDYGVTAKSPSLEGIGAGAGAIAVIASSHVRQVSVFVERGQSVSKLRKAIAKAMNIEDVTELELWHDGSPLLSGADEFRARRETEAVQVRLHQHQQQRDPTASSSQQAGVASFAWDRSRTAKVKVRFASKTRFALLDAAPPATKKSPSKIVIAVPHAPEHALAPAQAEPTPEEAPEGRFEAREQTPRAPEEHRESVSAVPEQHPSACGEISEQLSMVFLPCFARELAIPNENYVLSPAPVFSSLLALVPATASQTQEQLCHVLRTPACSTETPSDLFSLLGRLRSNEGTFLAAAILRSEQVSFSEEFTDSNMLEIVAADGTSADEAADAWASSTSQKQAPPFTAGCSLNGPIAALSVATVPLTFEGATEVEDSFQLADETSLSCLFLSFVRAVQVAETETCTLLAMLCGGFRLSILLPPEGQAFDPSLLETLVSGPGSNASERRARVLLPKVSISWSGCIEQPMGLDSLLCTEGADFGPMTDADSEPIHVGSVAHSANVAFSAPPPTPGSGSQHEEDEDGVSVLKVGRPFLFLLSEKSSGLVVAFGKVVDPSLSVRKEEPEDKAEEVRHEELGGEEEEEEEEDDAGDPVSVQGPLMETFETHTVDTEREIEDEEDAPLPESEEDGGEEEEEEKTQ